MIRTEMPPKPMDLNEWAYTNIKRMILVNDFPPGSQLNIEDLTARFKISRTPVREALLRLRQEGLVESQSRVGFFVCGITEVELKDLFELREIIECHAAERCASLLADNDLATLERYVAQSQDAFASGDHNKVNEAEIHFHDLILCSTGNPRLIQVMANVQDLLHRQRYFALSSEENLKLSIEEHKAIFAALASRQPADARLAMWKHTTNVKGRLIQLLPLQGK